MIDWIRDQIHNNDFFSGAVAAAALGWAGYVARGIPKALWAFVRRRVNFEFTANSDNLYFSEILTYVGRFASESDRRRHISAYNVYYSAPQDPDDPESKGGGSMLEVAPATYFTFHRGRPTWLTISEHRSEHTGGWSRTVHLTGLFWPVAERDRFAADLVSLFTRREPRMIVVTGSSTSQMSIPGKTWDSIFIDPAAEIEIRGAIARFRDPEVRRRKASVGVRNKLGILLHGPPGCGKTSVAYAIANDLGAPLYVFNLSDFHSPSGLAAAWERVRRGSVVLFDDIDAQGSRLSREAGVAQGPGLGAPPHAGRAAAALPDSAPAEGRITISSLLSMLDGPTAKNDVVAVLTTNAPSALDPALKRRGRIDVAAELREMGPAQKGALYRLIAGEEIPAHAVDQSGADVEYDAFARFHERLREGDIDSNT